MGSTNGSQGGKGGKGGNVGEGLVDLTAMWRAAGRPKSKTTTNFRRTAGCRGFVVTGHVVMAKHGVGTWGDQTIAEAYGVYLGRAGARGQASAAAQAAAPALTGEGAARAAAAAAAAFAAERAARAADGDRGAKRAYRRLSWAFHPDRGGDLRSMSILNAYKDVVDACAAESSPEGVGFRMNLILTTAVFLLDLHHGDDLASRICREFYESLDLDDEVAAAA